MQKLRIVSLWLLVILLVSCSASNSTPDPYATEIATIAFLPTASEIISTPHIAVSTEASTPALPTLTPHVPLTTVPEAHLEIQCLKVLPRLPDDTQINGLIVAGAADGKVYLLDPNTGASITLPQRPDGFTFADLHVSPDRKWLAYRSGNVTLNALELVVTAADGQPVEIIPWEQSWRMISGWLDNERVLISRETEPGYPEAYDALVVVNPFTALQQELLPEYPNFGYWYPHPNWAWFYRNNTIYDPSLNRVLYPGISDEGSDLLYLWDLQTKHEIVVVTGTVSLGVTPKWSPDAQNVVIVGPSTLLPLKPQAKLTTDNDELYRISRDGEIQRLTYLTELYSRVRVTSFSFSPDGRYVAYWFYAEPTFYPAYPDADPQSKSHVRLAVLDMTTQEVTDYCLPGFPGGAPEWSPDSQYLVVEDEDKSLPPDPAKSHVYVVDIAHGFAVQIADIATLDGWMVTTP